MSNPRNELHDICKRLVENSTTDYGIDDKYLVQSKDFEDLSDCLDRCNEYSKESARSFAQWCKERGQFP